MLQKIKLSFNLVFFFYSRLENLRKFQLKLLFIFAILTSLLEVATLFSLYPFISILFNSQSIAKFEFLLNLKDYFLFSEDSYLLVISIIFLFFLICSSVFRAVLLWANVKLANSISKDFSLDIFKNKIYQPYLKFIESNSNETIANVSIKIGSLNRVLIALNSLGTGVFITISILVAALVVNPVISILVFLIIFLLYLILVFYFNKVLTNNSIEISNQQSSIVKILQESSGMIKDILLDGSQEKYLKVFSNSINKLYDADTKNNFISLSPRYFIEAAGIILIILIFFYTASVSGNPISLLPTIGVLVLSANKVIPLMQQIYSNINIVVANYGQLADLGNFLVENSKCTKKAIVEKFLFNEKIIFNNVSFKFSTKKGYIIKNINFEIKKGEKIGIAGKTGEGKSTLLNLIMGLYPPSEGQIEIDNKILTSTNTKSWQSLISHVPQDIFLIDSTILENITFSSTEDYVNFKLLNKVIEQAQLKEFINSIPHGIYAVVGERGVKLSGGQRQRIIIARSLYKNPSLLVFDEATSSLDNQTEEIINLAFKSFSKNITFIVVAHRSSSLRECERIFEIKEKKLIIHKCYNDFLKS
jgi:ABC-type bacteriocin/lantibiotic exporter with double-glycine peptidase domain